MYKRPARVLFVAAEGGRSALAAARSLRFTAGWAEARAALPAALLEQGQLAWPDLLVTLDEASRRRLPTLPPRLRAIHWPLPESEHEACSEIDRRIAGMVGGMRMLARSD